jgi:hypothetical protein
MREQEAFEEAIDCLGNDLDPAHARPLTMHEIYAFFRSNSRRLRWWRECGQGTYNSRRTVPGELTGVSIEPIPNPPDRCEPD